MATTETEEIKDKVKFNAAEGTQIDLVLTDKLSTVVVREVVAEM